MTVSAIDNARAGHRFVGFLTVVMFFLSALFFVGQGEKFLGDPDLWWHIKTGQGILATWSLPHTDEFSYTFAGKPWIAKEWLSQILLALAYNLAGWNGVIILAGLAGASAVTLLYSALASKLNPVMMFFFVLVIALLLTPMIIARPHMFTLVLAVLMMIRLFRRADEQRPPEFWLLAVIVLWVNLHGSFTLGLLIAGFAFLYAMQKSRLKDLKLAAKWLAFLALGCLAALVNPYGREPFMVNYVLIGGIDVMKYINEWKPLNVVEDFGEELGLLAMLGLLIWAHPKLLLSKVAFLLLMLHMMLTHIRFLYLPYLLGPLLVYGEVAAANPKVTLESWMARARDGLQMFIGAWQKPAMVLAGLAGVLELLVPAYLTPHQVAHNNSITGAFGYINEHHLTGPVFNEYSYGGPLIFNGTKTFIDGRADQLFLGQFFTDYMASGGADGQPVLAKILQDYKVEWTLLPSADRRNEYLAAMPEWQKTFSDELATIYERKKN